MAVFRGSPSSSKPTRQFGGHGASGFMLFTLICLLVSVLNVDASRYRGVSRHKNSRYFHCETYFRLDSSQKKIYFGSFETERMAALACDVAFFYTGMPSTKFNFRWSKNAISNLCKPRSLYAILDNRGDRKTFIKAQAYDLMSLVPEFHLEDIILEPTDVDRVPTLRQRSEWIAWRIVHHFRNQPWRVREFMAWFMEPSTEGRILEVHAQKFPSATYDDVVLSAPQVNSLVHVNMDMNDIIEGVGSLEARPGRELWLLLFFGSALSISFKLFESDRAGGENDDGTNDFAQDAPSTSRRLPGASKKQKACHHQHDFQRDEDLFKASIVCSHGGLTCADVSKSRGKDSLVVFNPSTTETYALPPLLYPRSPVLVHMVVDSESMSYKVLAAGSATAGTEHLSKKIEVFDSTTSRWEEAPELPGPAFGLNQYQTGVCVDGVLYFIAFLEGDGGKGVVAFDVGNRTWLKNSTRPIPLLPGSDISQLVESNGKKYLLWDRSGELNSKLLKHSIDVLEISNPEEKCQRKKIVRVPNKGSGLEVYPEYTCVSFGDGKLCVLDTLNRTGEVYDTKDGSQCEELQPPPSDLKDKFFNLNPASFALQLSIDSDPRSN